MRKTTTRKRAATTKKRAAKKAPLRTRVVRATEAAEKLRRKQEEAARQKELAARATDPTPDEEDERERRRQELLDERRQLAIAREELRARVARQAMLGGIAVEDLRALTKGERPNPRRLELATHLGLVLEAAGIKARHVERKLLTEAQRKMIFLEMYREFGNLRAAGMLIGVTRKEVAEWRAADPGFRADMADAYEDSVDQLEMEAWRRAVIGEEDVTEIEKPDGVEVRRTWRYSDGLMNTLLRGMRPERYKDRTEHSTPDGRPMQVEDVTAESKAQVMASLLGLIAPKKDPK